MEIDKAGSGTTMDSSDSNNSNSNNSNNSSGSNRIPRSMATRGAEQEQWILTRRASAGRKAASSGTGLQRRQPRRSTKTMKTTTMGMRIRGTTMEAADNRDTITAGMEIIIMTLMESTE